MGFSLCPGREQRQKENNSKNHLQQMPAWSSSRQTCFLALIGFHYLYIHSSAEECFVFRESPDIISRTLQETDHESIFGK